MATRIKKLELPQIKGYTFNKEKHVHALDGKPLTGVTTILSVIAKPMLIQWAANMACDYISNYVAEKWSNSYEAGSDTYLAELLPVLKEARTAHRKKKEAAGDWGTDVHSFVEQAIKKSMAVSGEFLYENFNDANSDEFHTQGVNEKIQEVFNHFCNWANQNKVKFLASEKNVWSEKMWVGGICDIICEIDGKRYVGDIKTSSGIYPEHFIQASAYAQMLTEMKEYEPNQNPEFETAFDGVVIINLKKDGTFDYQYNYDVEGNFNCFKAALTLYRHLNAITK